MSGVYGKGRIGTVMTFNAKNKRKKLGNARLLFFGLLAKIKFEESKLLGLNIYGWTIYSDQ